MGCLGSFVSVGGPEGRNVVVEKEKGNVGDRVAAGWLVQVCPWIRALAKHGVKLLPLDFLVASPTLSRSHLESNKLTAQSDCCMGGGA